MRSASALPGLARVTIMPEEMLAGLVRGRRAFGDAAIVKPHFFCFCGDVETARWLHHVIDGAFELNEDGSRFTVRPD